jgi:hypothetical protein
VLVLPQRGIGQVALRIFHLDSPPESLGHVWLWDSDVSPFLL